MTTISRPAFYAVSTGNGGLRDWITLLHPPYTAWHLSYVVIGAALAPSFAWWRLGGTVAAFFLAVGVAAHALDELHGRPLGTGIPAPLLVIAAGTGVVVPVAVGWWYGGLRLLPFIVIGAALVIGYDLELAGGRLHTAVAFGVGWGAFPVLTGYYAQDFRLGVPAVLAAAGAFLLTLAQRALSTFARLLRRHAVTVDGHLVLDDGQVMALDQVTLLEPAEKALRATTAAVVVLALALVATR